MSSLLVASRSSEPHNGGWSPIGRLEFDSGTYRFVYTQGARTAKGFTPFSGMEKLDDIYESAELFPIFANRLLSKSRPEYEAYLKWSGFDPDNPPDPISILGVTEGRRQTDAIEVFPCPVPDSAGCYVNRFFAHGLRRFAPGQVAQIKQLQPEEQLYFLLERHNYFDPQAVSLVNQDKMMAGFVPRYLARDIRLLVRGCESDYAQVFVQRVNIDAPLQQRLLCRMHACWPADFKPCSGEEFEPIPEGVPVDCDGSP